MKKLKDKSHINEIIAYTAIWSSVVLFPLILELWELINGQAFDWMPIKRWWVGALTLFVVFLFNNYLLMPFLLKKGRLVAYLLSALAVLGLFGGHHHYSKPHRPPIDNYIDLPDLAPQGFPPAPDGPHPGPFDFDGNPGPPHHDRTPRLPLPEIFLLVLALMTLAINIAISMMFQNNRERVNFKELENYRLQEELKYLKQQISPHFFMNMLNNIHEMAEEDVTKAQNMIIELSQLMRHALYEEGSVSLASEINFISSYVSLMKMRYPDESVKINITLPEHPSEGKKVPTMLFISFIENAFKHGVTYLSPTTINIELAEMEHRLIFRCTNTLPAQSTQQKKGGVGLANVRRRLDLLYKEDYSLEIIKNEETYTVTLDIPC